MCLPHGLGDMCMISLELLALNGYRSGVIDILIGSVRHIGWRIVGRQAIWWGGILVLTLRIMGAARTSQIFAYHISGWMIHLVDAEWGRRVHLSNNTGSGNCNRIGFHYLLHAHHGLHHCGHLLFHGLHVGLHLLLYLLYFTHYSSSSTSWPNSQNQSPVESPTVATCPSRASEGEAHGKIGEKLAAQLAQASKVASSRSNNLLEESSGGPKWAWLSMMDSNSPFLPHCNSDTKNAFRKPSGDAANRNYRRRSPVEGSPSPDVLLNGGHGGAMAVFRGGFSKKRQPFYPLAVFRGGYYLHQILLVAFCSLMGKLAKQIDLPNFPLPKLPSNVILKVCWLHHLPLAPASPRHGHSSSPNLVRENSARVSHHSRKYDDREQDQQYGRNHYGRSSDSLRHSDRQSFKSSYGHSRHDKYANEDRYREKLLSRSGHETRDDHMRDESDSRSKNYQRSVEKYSHDKYDRSDHRSKEKRRETYLEHQKYKDMDSSYDKSASSKRHALYDEVEREGHSRDWDGRNERRDSRRSSGDYRSDQAVCYSESRNQRDESGPQRDCGKSSLKEGYKSEQKESNDQNLPWEEKRKHDDTETGKGKDWKTRQASEQCGIEDKESSGKKLKLFDLDKDDNYRKDDESKTSSSKLSHESKADVRAAKTSGFDGDNDLDAAKVAAMRAAELVNRNLVGAGCLTTDQKKKLLWGGKRSTPTEEPPCICKGKVAYNIPPPYLRIAKSLWAMGYEVFIT
ncbi:hypothetical protein HKD37_02G004503 [Glycine soja]